ncbi:YggS family pyridoxal phosphate-dependent enzyme [Neptunomonas sp. XY-337]|uniref:YggS family pyridoxal phosphate-dependent enzyme n=1 Tax=Neptunomonas sp. XY-337 TaxID=2561897 RepID=UPI0010AA8F63|nr:YggS family pyridoxal phosphate-dependent enzyme [Neptunomonas sp. XY-337]
MTSIAEKYRHVCQQIEQAATQAHRSPDEVLLLAVSKTRSSAEVRALHQLGQRDFGENYLQEALDKIDALNDQAIVWHFIGPIQSNKTRPIAERFAWVHSVDREKIARRLSEQRPADTAPLNICLQVNISEEVSKSGCLPSELPALIDAVKALPGIRLRGLMAIPAATDDPAEQRAALHAMQQLFQAAKTQVPGLDTLSMGMSGDMEEAVAQGATIVRIGTALFGPRNYANN